jgi:cytochrome c5
MKNIVIVLILSALTGFAYAGAKDSVHSIELPKVTTELKAGEGKDVTERFCIICHSLDYITMQPKFTRAQWTAVVNKMIKVMGAPIPEEDAKIIEGYLTTGYGTGG